MLTQTGQRKALALVVLGVGGLMLLSAGLWVAFSLPPEEGPTALPSVPPPNDDVAVPRVSLQEARAAFDAGSAMFVDTRSLGSYEASHIAGAISIPLGETVERLQELDPGQWIITYCT